MISSTYVFMGGMGQNWALSRGGGSLRGGRSDGKRLDSHKGPETEN